MSDHEPTRRIHVQIFDSDLKWLQDTYSQTIGVSKAVRAMVRAMRNRAEAKAQASRPPSPPPSLAALDL